MWGQAAPSSQWGHVRLIAARKARIGFAEAACAARRLTLAVLLLFAPAAAWAASAGCGAIGGLSGVYTVDAAGDGTDKFTNPPAESIANGETVTYSWSGNTKGAYVYIVWTQGGTATYAPSSVQDSTAASGSGSFTFSGTTPEDYFQVGLSDTGYLTGEPTKPASRDSTVTITLSCTPGSTLAVAMSHSGNAAQGGTLAYTVLPTVADAATTSAPLTASFTLPTGMTFGGASGSGWTCTGSGQNGSCSRTTGFGPGSGPAITLTAQFAANAATTLTPSVTLSGGGATNTAVASDPTVVAQLPTVTALSPSSGPTSGGTQVVVTGTNLASATAVRFGAIPASFTVNSATQITATAPAGSSGTVDVTVTTAAGTSSTSASDHYTYLSAPNAANVTGIAIAFNAPQAIDLSGSITGSHTGIVISTAPVHGSTAVAGDVVTYTPVANYAGPDSFAYTATGPGGTSAPATVTLNVAQGSQTITFAPLANASLSASPLTLSASASSGLGVSFTPGTPSICSVSGMSLTLLQVGTCTVNADQAGNATYAAAPTVTRSFTVTPATLAIAAGSASGLTVGTSYSQANPASGGTGPYSYSLDAGALPPGTTLNSSTGTVSGTPTVAGSFSYIVRVTDSQPTPATTTSSVVTVAIAKGNQTLAFTSTAPAAAMVGGASYTVTANASSTLAPTFVLDGASTGCALSGSTVTFIAPGTCVIDASQAGDANWNAAPPVQQSFTVGMASAIASSVAFSPSTLPAGTTGTVTITFSNPNAAASPGFTTLLTADDLLARVAGAPGGSCSGVSTSIPTTASVQLTFASLATGSCTVTFGYRGVTAGSAVGFTLGSFAPAGYPATPAASSNVISVLPAVTAISPASGPAGQAVTIAGAGFSATPGNNTVRFGATSVPVTSASPTEITVAAPTGESGTVGVTVTTNGQTSASGPTFSFIAPPVAADRSGVVVAYQSAGTAIDLSGAITGGPHTTIAVAAAPSHGTLTVAGDIVTYTPATGYFGSDSFTYNATGPAGVSNTATVSLTVTTPTAPTLTDRTGVAVPYNGTGTAIDLSGAVTGVHSSLSIGTSPAHGTVSIAGDVVTYTPTAGYYGADSFTFTATGPGGTSAPGTVGLTVAVPPAPTVSDRGGITVAYASSGTAIDLSGSIAGIHSSLAIATPPSHGTAVLAGDVATYTPAPAYSGADSFTFTATGPGGTSAAATVTLTVTTPAAPTVADRTGIAVPYQGRGTAIDLSGSITGVHGAVAIVSPPAHGSASVNGDVVTYIPAAGYYGADSFTVTASGPGGTSAPATIGVTVATPATPVVSNRADVAVAYGSTGATIDLSGQIVGVHSALTVATTPSHGTVTIDGDIATYVPTAGYFGADSFAFTATGPGGASAPATVGLTVASPPAPAVAGREGVAVPYDSPGTTIDLSGSVSGVYAALTLGSEPAHGTATISGTNAVYVPTPGYFGADSFTFTATGPGGTSGAATVALTVAAPPPPIAQAGTAKVAASVGARQSVDIDLSALVTGQYTTVEIAGQPSHGTVALQGAPGFVATYAPESGFAGTDTFTFVAVGPGGRSDPASVSITVIGAVPTAAAKAANAIDNQLVSVELTEAATGGPFTGAAILSVSSADQASVRIVESGSGAARSYRLDIQPAPRFGGTLVITYTLSNAFGTSAPATVTVTVTARPDPSLDPAVRAISDAQAESARRFAQAQSRNFLQRAEQLHDGGGSQRPQMGISLGMMGMARGGMPAGFASERDTLEVIGRMRGVANSDVAGTPGAYGGRFPARAGAAPVGSSGADGERPVGSVAVWTGGQVEFGTRDRTEDRDRISISTGGLSAGADIKLADAVTLGLGGGIGFDHSRIGEDAGRVRSESRVIAAYGSTRPVPGMFADFVLGYGDLDFRTRRAVNGAIAIGSRDGTMWFGAASAGIDRTDGSLRWSLYGRGEWLDASLGSYVESGAGLMDLRFDRRDADALTGVLGGRFEIYRRIALGTVRPRIRLEWSHAFQGASVQWLDYADIPGDAFYGIRSEGWRRDQYEVALGGGLYTLSQWIIDLELGLRAASEQRDGRVTVKVSKEF